MYTAVMWLLKPKTLTVWKLTGETPLIALNKLRDRYPWLRNKKLAYAGRLDPMASGKMLVVVGKECRRMKRYLGLDKKYEVEILFGMASDTGDILGIVSSFPPPKITPEKVNRALRARVGEFNFPYPAYSSKTFDGKHLFQWALEGRLNEIKIPLQHSRIYRAKLISVRTMSTGDIVQSALKQISMLPRVTEKSKALGRDFRRKDVIDSWMRVLANNKKEKYVIVRVSVLCSSGTYMRSLSEVIAHDLGTEGLAFSIKRTWIGKLWSRRFYGI
ncbi:MAG TPA: hypothetical protein ENJ75_02960 [Candidatus Kaiserbacteria bacterium]|nr:hypothetical protein [Candidatus Kaiserbacteria bacterium]